MGIEGSLSLGWVVCVLLGGGGGGGGGEGRGEREKGGADEGQRPI